MICFDMQKPPNASFTGDNNDYKGRGGMNPGKPYPYPWSTKNNLFIWDNPVDIDKVVKYALKISESLSSNAIND